jgi:hypothetical protein
MRTLTELATLRFEKRLGEAGAVDRDKRLAGAY